NQNISNQNISNQNISNQNISNTTITDSTYAVTNSGNTTHSYRVALYGNNGSGKPIQLIVTKNYSSPTSVGCVLQNLPQTTVLANVNNAPIAPTLAAATDPNIPDGTTTNATMALAPGETAFVTLRGALTADQMAQLTRGLTPVVTAHGKNTNGSANDFAMLLFIQTTGGTTLPAAVVGTSYSWTFQVLGGKSPLSWSLAPGSTLPPGLTLSSSGTLSGTPTGGGSYSFTVKVTDSTAGTHQTATQTFNLTVTGAATTITLVPSPASPAFAQPLTLTATVTTTSTAPGLPALTGSVDFFDGDTKVGSAPVSGGTASFTTSALSTGPHSFTAAYSGDVNYTGTLTTGPVTVTVTKAASTTALSSSVNPSTFGQLVTFSATVSGPGTTPSGTVTFSDGSSTIGTGTLNSSGVATLSTSSLSVATHSVTATYGGDGNFNGSASSTLSQGVQKADSATVVAAAPNPSTFRQSVTFTATVSGPGGTPSGTVTFTEGATTIGTGTLAGGVATISTASLSVATHSITASYSGDSSFNGSASLALSQVVNKAPSAAAVSATPNPSTFGQSVTFTATASGLGGTPTGSVTFFDGATTIGAGVLNSSGIATLSTAALSVGSHAITASYAGDSNFAGSSSGTMTQVVNVPPFTFSGFQTPLATAGTLTAPTNSGSANYGNGVPVKYQLLDYLGNNVTDLSTTTLIQAIANSSCVSGHAPDGAATLLYSPTTGAKGGSTFRSGSSGFIFNWDTGVVPGPGCYTLVVQLNDGSAAKATNIQLK
ncbi:MAG TPA: Ig-like domain repeat protein, partial [Thermoanaerobaculia bacterium]|nr:Ig-like domain repeat protein [Thermoanaerobaculia bacterium]